MSEEQLTALLAYITAVNELLDAVDVLAALRTEIETLRARLCDMAREEDAGINNNAWVRVGHGGEYSEAVA